MATLFTPLVNGPIIALTARTPEALRAKVMTAVILAEHGTMAWIIEQVPAPRS